MNIKITTSGFGTALTIVFIILKLNGTIDWSWAWVFAPLWITAIVLIAVIAGALSLANHTANEQENNRSKRKSVNGHNKARINTSYAGYVTKTLSNGGDKAVDLITTISDRFVDNTFAASTYAGNNLTDPFRSEPVKDIIRIAYIYVLSCTSKYSIPNGREVSLPKASTVLKTIRNTMTQYGFTVGRAFSDMQKSESVTEQAFCKAAEPYMKQLNRMNMSDEMKRSALIEAGTVLQDAVDAEARKQQSENERMWN